MKISLRALASATSLLTLTPAIFVQAAELTSPGLKTKPSSLRVLQGSAEITLADGKVISVDFTSATSCRATIESSPFVVRSCNSCSVTCSTSIVSFDCNVYFDADPCSVVDCDGNCSNGQASPTILELAPSPTLSPVMDVEAPSSAPAGAPSASPVDKEAPSASPVAEEAPSASPVAAPSSSPVEDSMEAPSASPVAAPSSSPVEGSMEAPSASPVAAPSASPVEGSMEAPSASPIMVSAPTAAVSAAPSASQVPSYSAMPIFSSVAPECAMNSGCANLNLTGLCCPTVDGWILDCCNDDLAVEETCELNPDCDALGLKGTCCPTPNEEIGYLDCCSSLPDECIEGNCTIGSASEYLQMVQGRDGVAALNGDSNSGATSPVSTAGVLLLLAVVTLGMLL